jgi:SAM-dependent methyltransferase
MDDHREENRRLWNEWSDDFQALWEADTGPDELPPAPSPFGPDAPGGQPPVEVAGKRHVELGCGGGQGTVGTADLGVDVAVGVDLSGAQLEHARRLRERYGVDAQFLQADVTDLPLRSDAFDLASSEAVFQMVADLAGALEEVHRVLRTEGLFVLSVPHPLYEALDLDAGAFEHGYLDTGRRSIEIDEAYDADLVAFDRTVGQYHDALVAAGFDVRRVIEHPHPVTEDTDPEESDHPDLLWDVPRSVRFWARPA